MFGTTVYQGLGTDVSPEMSIQEMRTKAGLDWEVRKTPLYKKVGDEYVEVPAFSLERDDNYDDLEIVKKRGAKPWNPHYMETQFGWLDRWIEKGVIKPHSLGHFKGGRIVWVMATIDDKFDLFEGDTIEGNLLFTNFHQYGRAIDIRNTAMRWNCLNSFLYGLSQEVPNCVKVDHQTEFDAEYVNETLGIAKHRLQEFRESAEFLASKRADTVAIQNYVSELFPIVTKGTEKLPEEKFSRPARQVLEHVHDQPGAQYGEGTWWQAFNAVTFAVDHVHGTDKNRQQAAWYGQGVNRKINALSKALEYAEKS